MAPMRFLNDGERRAYRRHIRIRNTLFNSRQATNCIGEKRCYKCGLTFPTSEFAKDSSRYRGIGNLCKSCNAAKTEHWRQSQKSE